MPEGVNSDVNARATPRPRSKNEQILQKKTWHSSALLKSIKIKNKMYAYLQKRYDEQQRIFYKSCRNALNKAVEKAKQNYYNHAIISAKNDRRKIWKTIHDLAKIKTKKSVANIISSSLECAKNSQIMVTVLEC